MSADIGILAGQQAAVAAFGSFAFRESDLLKVLAEAARMCAEKLRSPFSTISRYRPETNDLVIETGHGWTPAVLGQAIALSASPTLERALLSGEPRILNMIDDNFRLELSPFQARHGVMSIITVVIDGDDHPYGVLEIASNEHQAYDRNDVDFLTAAANILAEAVVISSRMSVLRTTIRQMKLLVDQQTRLLDQKKILAEELQHRVRNNLQLVYGMLTSQLDQTTDHDGRRGIRAIARRVSTLAEVYEHVLGNSQSEVPDFVGYIRSLCGSLAGIEEIPGSDIQLTCESDTLELDIETITALGIIVAELVSNSFEHAFPGGKGAISVSVRALPATAILTIRDNGPGFTVDPKDKRRGLGLVRRLVEQIRGTVSLHFDPGTVWTIGFPRLSRTTAHHSAGNIADASDKH